MPARILAVWLLLLAIAIVAAAVRERLLVPVFGEHWAHAVGTVIVVVVFAGVIWLTVGWVAPALGRAQLATTGAAWLVATVLFEFDFGHYVMRHSWARLLADYNLLAGRLWLLVLLTVLRMPVIAGGLQRAAP